MIQINLLPDIKREYLKSQQVKHTFIVGSVIVSLLAIVLCVLAYGYVQFLQPMRQKALQTDIDDTIKSIKNKKYGSRAATTQSALASISGLQDKKVFISKILPYVGQFTPEGVQYDQIKISIVDNRIELGGGTNDLKLANILANNLKSAKLSYKKDGQDNKVLLFKDVQFSSLDKASTTTVSSAKPIAFMVAFTYDPVLVDQTITEAKVEVDAPSVQLQVDGGHLFSSQQPTLPANNTESLGGTQ